MQVETTNDGKTTARVNIKDILALALGLPKQIPEVIEFRRKTLKNGGLPPEAILATKDHILFLEILRHGHDPVQPVIDKVQSYLRYVETLRDGRFSTEAVRVSKEYLDVLQMLKTTTLSPEILESTQKYISFLKTWKEDKLSPQGIKMTKDYIEFLEKNSDKYSLLSSYFVEIIKQNDPRGNELIMLPELYQQLYNHCDVRAHQENLDGMLSFFEIQVTKDAGPPPGHVPQYQFFKGEDSDQKVEEIVD